MTGKSETTNSPPGERIAKAMARAGMCSRREAEAWIAAGRVSVNGKVIKSPALNVTDADRIVIDGAALPQKERTRLFLYNKPRGLVTTHVDPQGRPTIFGALPKHLPRLISVGRLDLNTEGLLLLTNDGGLARVLELPETGWLRRYRVRALGRVTQDQLNGLRKGITIDGIHYGPVEATIDREQGANVWITFAIREGKNREVRNVLRELGLSVNRLIRVSFGPFQLGELAPGGVEEIKSRTLREQLGDKLVAKSGADFTAPLVERAAKATHEPAAPLPSRIEARRRPGWVAGGARSHERQESASPKPSAPALPAARKGSRGGSKEMRRQAAKQDRPDSDDQSRNKHSKPQGRRRNRRSDRSGGPRPSRPRPK